MNNWSLAGCDDRRVAYYQTGSKLMNVAPRRPLRASPMEFILRCPGIMPTTFRDETPAEDSFCLGSPSSRSA